MDNPLALEPEVRELVSEPLALRLGNSAAPVVRAVASACTRRATAAAMSRLTVWASSISCVNSRERKPRHQSSVGGASGLLGVAALYPWGLYTGATSRAGSGRSWFRTQPAELATMQNAASHLAARPGSGTAADMRATATQGRLWLTFALRQAKCPASAAARAPGPVRGVRLGGMFAGLSPV